MCLVLALVLGDASGVNVVYYVIAMLCFLELHASMVNLNVDFIGELILLHRSSAFKPYIFYAASSKL